ncbi:MAG: hypothetical protein P1U53_07010 [Sulfitobacter sp.]|nr:hypothetical protein [Sulfitobacter sp.]
MRSMSVALVALTMLSACGGTRYADRGGAPVVLFATGPIQKACLSGGRKAASRERCGCVQAVADRELSAAEQRRGARFFKDPHGLQEVRQSDNASNEQFWRVWKAYGQKAEGLCRGT